VENIVFASSSTIYGDVAIVPTPENYGPLKPISVYGTSKLACEAPLSSYCYSFKKKLRGKSEGSLQARRSRGENAHNKKTHRIIGKTAIMNEKRHFQEGGYAVLL